MRFNRLALILCAMAASCGNNVTVGNDNPTGTVGGIVVDAATEMPLPNVMINIVSASAMLSAMSDMNGVWQITKVPAGSFILTMTQMGYVTARFNATLSGSVGNFPVNNPALTIGPTGLIKSSGAFTVRLVDQNGAPAGGVRAVARPQVRYIDFSGASLQPIGDYDVEGTSGNDGLVHFTGLPDYPGLGQVVSDFLPVDIAPTKIMGSEVYSFLGIEVGFNVSHLSEPTPTIVLAGPKTGLGVLTSSIDYLRTGGLGPVGSIVPIMGPINIAFNQAISPTTIRATFQSDDGKVAPIAAMTSVQGNLVTIMPSAGFTPGLRYNLVFHAAAAQALLNGGQYDVTAPFFAQQTAGVNPSTVTAKIDSTGPTLLITLNEAIGLGAGYGPNYTLGCAAYYEGVNFDNDSTTAYQGEWVSGAPAALVCPSPGTPPAVNVTNITAVEMAGPTTGFSSKWRITFDGPAGSTGGCSPAIVTGPGMAPGCIRPAAGTKVHLVFSHQSNPALTVHRVNGDPVGDDIVAIITP